MSNTVSKGRKIIADHRPGRKCKHVDCARAGVLPSRIWAHFLRANRDGMCEAYDLEQCKKLEAELEACRASIAARKAA